MVKKQRNNLAIFGPFLDLQDFFKNRGLSFEASDSDLRDLLDELLHMAKKFRKTNQNDRFYFKVPNVPKFQKIF